MNQEEELRDLAIAIEALERKRAEDYFQFNREKTDLLIHELKAKEKRLRQ